MRHLGLGNTFAAASAEIRRRERTQGHQAGMRLLAGETLTAKEMDKVVAYLIREGERQMGLKPKRRRNKKRTQEAAP
jgi:hypothetical protein